MKSFNFVERKLFMYCEDRWIRIKYGEVSMLLAGLNLDDIYKFISNYFKNMGIKEVKDLKREINQVDKLKHISNKYYFNFVYPLNAYLIKEYEYIDISLLSIISEMIMIQINNRIDANIYAFNNMYSSGKSDYLKLKQDVVNDIDSELTALIDKDNMNTQNALLKEQSIDDLYKEIEENYNKIINGTNITEFGETVNQIKNHLKAINQLSDDSEKDIHLYLAILDIIFYIPNCLYDKGFQEDLKNNILKIESFLYSYNLNELISNTKVTMTKRIEEDGSLATIYQFSDINSLLCTDLQKYHEIGITAKNCEYCGRLFLPKSKKIHKFCNYSNKGTTLKCFDLNRKEENDFRKEAKKARGNQQRFVQTAKGYKDSPSNKFEYDYLKLEEAYSKWLRNISEAYFKYKAEDDLQGFKDWIQTNKFFAKKMEHMGIRKILKKSGIKSKYKIEKKNQTG